MHKRPQVPTRNTSQLEPISDTEWPVSLNDLRDTFASKLNIYRVMAHHPALLRAWTPLRDHVVNNSALTPEQSEVVILRASVNLNADYEWQTHLLRSLDLGMALDRIEGVQGKPINLSPHDAVLCVAVDELVKEARLQDETVMALANLVGTVGVLDVMATVGFYTTLAMLLKTFNTPLDTVTRQRLIDIDRLRSAD